MIYFLLYINSQNAEVAGKEFARLKKCHTELWNKLMLLSNEQNIISSCFKYNKTFLQIDKKVDEINSQLSF